MPTPAPTATTQRRTVVTTARQRLHLLLSRNSLWGRPFDRSPPHSPFTPASAGSRDLGHAAEHGKVEAGESKPVLFVQVNTSVDLALCVGGYR